MTTFIRQFLAGILIALLGAQSAAAQGIRTLRDAEMEAFLHDITDPILVAGDMEPSNVEFIIVDDTSLNAFYAGGQAIFVHTGLILNTDNVNQVIGVMAHETGHMTAGHVQRMGEAIQPASTISILGLLLGAAAIAGGAPDAGIGLLMGSQSMAQRTVLKFRRVQEASADFAAVQYLEETGVSGKGFLEVLEKFRFEQLVVAPNLNPYAITHPLSSDRIANIENRMQGSPYWDKPVDKELQAKYERIKAKILGYVYPPHSTLGTYPPEDTSVPARYARIYAYNKAMEWDKALAEADSLIDESPDDPFFHEIKGQILLENGRVEESIPHLERAAALAPNQPLILTLYGQALVAEEDPKTDKLAADVLERAARLDPRNSFAWYHLAVIYTRNDEQALADLAAAERYLLMRDYRRAALHAGRAVEGLEPGTPKWLRAQDIRQVVAANMPEDGERRRR